MTSFTFAILVCVIAFVVVMFFVVSSGSQQTNAFETFRQRNPGGMCLHAMWSKTFVCVDTQRGKLIIEGKGRMPLKIDLSSIRDLQLVEDRQTITSTSNRVSLGRAAVGAVLAGPAGAVLGGVSGTSKAVSSALARKHAVRVLTRDLASPMHEVVFFDAPANANIPAGVTDLTRQEALRCYAALEAAVEGARGVRHSGGQASQMSAPEPATNFPKALGDLWALHQAGALTLAEYEQQKAKLLAASA